MKKKLFLLTAVTILAVSMTACGGTKATGNNTTPTTETETTTAPTVTEEPTATATPTEAPTETPVEPTEAPTETPVESTEVPTESAGNPADVAEDPNFAKIKEMASAYGHNYSEFTSIIETMDKTRYAVTEVDNLAIVLEDGLTEDEIAQNVKMFLEMDEFTSYVEEGGYYPWGTIATGEYYVMTLTDLVTNETVVWGFRVHLENTEKPGTYFVEEHGTALMVFMHFGSIQINEIYRNEIKAILGI